MPVGGSHGKLLPEDPLERQQFDFMMKQLNFDPLLMVQHALTVMHRCAEYPQGSHAKLLTIYVNEIAKARAKMVTNEKVK